VSARTWPLEPRVTLRDVGVLGRGDWESVEAEGARLLGAACVAVPSVRVALCWILEHLGCGRHRDHVLVPRFLGRCILNSLNRVALPVEVPTEATRAVVAVDQFGFRQRTDVVAEARRRGWAVIEDSPYGIGDREAVTPGVLARVVGLTKVLPVVQGALVLTADAALAQWIRGCRERRSAWTWAVWGAMSVVRHRSRVSGYSRLADAAYEMYVPAGGGNRLLRANMLRALRDAPAIGVAHRERVALIRARLGEAVLVPDLARVGYVVPYVPAGADAAQAVMREHGFDATLYHVDVARNVFAPRYVRALLLPLNHRIASARFTALIDALAAGAHASAAAAPRSAQAVAP
jgi:hypothetical protein